MLKKRIVLNLVFLFLFLASILIFPYPARSGGAYKTPITITNNANTDLTDYQVKIVLDNTWDGWDHVANDGSDIYFLDSSDNPLCYWIESFDYSNQEAVIWVKIPNIQASGSTTIYMYYGGDNPYSSYNDVDEVFILYDDFSVKDTDRWAWNGEFTVENGYAKGVNTDVFNHLYSTQFSVSISSSVGVIIITYAKNLGTVSAYDMQIGWYYDDTWGAVNIAVGSFDKWAVNGVYDDRTDWNEPDERSWHTYKIILYDGTWKFYMDNTLYSTRNNAQMHTLTKIWIASKGQSYWDWILVRKYVDPEPSISIGSSESVQQGVYPWFSASVSPTSVSVEPSDTISFDVNVTNTGSIDSWIVVSLVDHNNVTRDSQNVTISVNQSTIVTLSTIASEDDRGDWDWFIIGYNDTTTFFNISVSVSIHYSLSYSFDYLLNFSNNLNATGIAGIRYDYLLNMSNSINANNVGANRGSYDVSYCDAISIFVNDYLVYQDDNTEACIQQHYDPVYDIDAGALNVTGALSLDDRGIAVWITIAIITFILAGSYLLDSIGGLVIGLGFISILAIHGALPLWIAGITIIINMLLIYMLIRRQGGS